LFNLSIEDKKTKKIIKK